MPAAAAAAALLIVLLPGVMCVTPGSTQSAGVLSQTVHVTLTGIALIDNNGVQRADAFVGSGRLLATLTTSADGASIESTVCGPLDTVTSFFLCNHLGYISTLSAQGSVSGIDNEDTTGTPVVIRNLDCNGATTLEACQFEVLLAPDPACTHSQDATLECLLSVGGIAGLVSGVFGSIGVFTGVPILIVVLRFCCCRKRC